jgi:hypothetical protein
MAKYAITRAGSERFLRSAEEITSSTKSGGNTLVSRPTDTRSDRRRSETGFTQPARGTHPNYTIGTLTERYWTSGTDSVEAMTRRLPTPSMPVSHYHPR